MAIQDDNSMPKSRVTLRYRTEINGAKEDVVLPLRVLIAGDFSGYGPYGPDDGSVVGERDLNDVNKRASLDKRHIFDAKNIIGVEKDTTDENGNECGKYNATMKMLNIKSDGTDFCSMDDFSPDNILENSRIEIKEQLETRRLLSEVKSNLSNNKRYLQVMQDMLTDGENKVNENANGNAADSVLQTKLTEALVSGNKSDEEPVKE